MGLGKGGKKQTAETGPSKYQQQYLTPAIHEIGHAYNANKGQSQQIAAMLGGAIPGVFQKATAPNPSLDAAQTYNRDVLSGKYLGQGNRYLQAMVDKGRADATNVAGARFGALGGYGGSKYAEALGRGISDSELALRYGDYSKEREAMGQAASLTPGLVNAQYAGIAPLLSLIGGWNDAAYGPADRYAQNIAGLVGTNGSQTTSQKAGLGDILGPIAQAGAAALFASDRRLKTAIRRIGGFADGLGLYAWRYVWGGPEMIGVMADEVARIRPWALGPEIGGFKTVNYGRL